MGSARQMAPLVAPRLAGWSVAARALGSGEHRAMLPPPCYWIDDSDAAFLRWNMSTVAYVRRAGEKYRVTIQWRSSVHTGSAGSVAQGKRFIERWVSKQRGLPNAPRQIRVAR